MTDDNNTADSSSTESDDTETQIRETFAHVNFDATSPENFVDLVAETLETSDFIETTWMQRGDDVTNDILLVDRVEHGDN